MDLQVRTQTLNVTGGRFTNNIKGVDAQEFPIIPNPTTTRPFASTPDMLQQMIDQVVFAAATDESRPILTGVLAKFSGKTLTLAAADGFRLSVRTAQLEDGVDEPLEVIIPARALAELSRICGEQTDPISITVTPQKQPDSVPSQQHRSGLAVDRRQVPADYKPSFPKSTTTKSIIDTGLLLKACKAANVFAREAANIVRIAFAPGDEITPGHITIGAQSAETGENAGESGCRHHRQRHGDRLQREVSDRCAESWRGAPIRFRWKPTSLASRASSARSAMTPSRTSSCPCTSADAEQLTMTNDQ